MIKTANKVWRKTKKDNLENKSVNVVSFYTHVLKIEEDYKKEVGAAESV